MVNAEKTGLLILGMHRSGTSALTRILSLMGYELPQYVTGGSEGNKTGHWESALISEINDRLFQDLGLVWYSWSAIKLELLDAKSKLQYIDDYADKIQAEFPKATDFVLKDPRLCRTAPIFLKAVQNLGIKPKIIIPVRNPLEVADSLAARDNINKEQASLIWLRYVLDAELASRSLPRVFTFFDELLESSEKTVKHIVQNLNLKPSTKFKEVQKDIDRFINRKLQHHSYYRDDLVLDSAMRGWVRRSFSALVKLRDDPNDKLAMDQLDEIRHEFNETGPLFETILNKSFGEQQQKIDQKTREAQEAKLTVSELITVLETEKKQAQLTINELNTSLEMEKAQAKTSINDLNKFLEIEKSKAEQLEGEISQFSNTLIQRNQEIIEIKQVVKDKEKIIRSTKNKIKNLSNKKDHLLAELYDQKVQTSNLINDLGENQKSLDDAYIAHKQQVEHTEQAIADYKARDIEVRHLREVLAKEQRTVIKPALRNIRRAGGSILRSFLPDTFVKRLAFTIPTAEQKAILDMQARENNMANIQPNIEPRTQQDIKNNKSDIFIFAIIGWHFRTQRPQHIARELANRGHRVFYFEMDPPGANTEIEKLGDRLYRIKLKLEGAPQIQAYSGAPTPEQEKAWLKGFYAFCDEYKATPHKHLIIQHPFWWQLARLLTPEFHTLYDCMDDIAGFANSDQKLIDLEHDLLQGCDEMVVSGATLMHKYKHYNPLQIIRNAAQLDHFLTPDLTKLRSEFEAKTLVENTKKIKVGYVGAIADWFDTELLKQVARARRDVEFHFCGNISADHPHELKKESNVHFYGEIPYEQVPAFLDQMDILTIPFKIIPIIQACDPVKFYEYSALGKPTISTPLPELSRADHLVFFAEDAESFMTQVDAAFEAKNDNDFIEDLQNFAKNNTWSQRADKFHEILNTCPKISIVILAYGDPNLTNAAISSLKNNGDVYPNMEIIIVDNGSSAENIENMRGYASNFDGIKIIENGENLGFAAGNNVGIEAATGEYILLLNNDTFVSPGSIQAMMLHLKNNPSIGAIGPLTNNIGNEAKLSINYASMDEMVISSRALKTGYRGQYFETNVVAYFAVMFRQRDIDSFGLLSLDYGRGMFEDDDHCHIIKSKGFICAVAEDAFIHHHLSATFSKINDAERQKLFANNKATFEKKWGPWQAHKYREKRPTSDLQFPNENLIG